MKLIKLGLVALVLLTIVVGGLWTFRSSSPEAPTVQAPPEPAPTLPNEIPEGTNWQETLTGMVVGLSGLEIILIILALCALLMFIGGAIWGGIQVLREGTSTWPKRSFYALAGVSFLVLIGITLMTFEVFSGLMMTIIESREEIFRPLIHGGELNWWDSFTTFFTTTNIILTAIGLFAFSFIMDKLTKGDKK
jgi:hypothetical protein